MSVRAKKLPIETQVIIQSSKGTKLFLVPRGDEAKLLKFMEKYEDESIPWRQVAKDEIEKYSEPGVMLKGARLRTGLSQKALAKRMEIEQSHISQMEHGKRPIGKSMAKRLAEVLGVDYHLFL
jgi:ribosome-binding protein aMBF1 (putative translation factor)